MSSAIATATLWGRAPAPRRHEETDLQASVMAFLAWALPPDAIAHHSPGEGKRTKRAQGELKRSGYQRGWPDIEIVWRRQPHPIFIELKAARGVMSEAQREMHRRLTYIGADVLVCRSAEGVECALRELGVPLRGAVQAAINGSAAQDGLDGASRERCDGQDRKTPAADSDNPDARRQGEDYPSVGRGASLRVGPGPLEPAA